MSRTSSLAAAILTGTALLLGACASGTPGASSSPSGGSVGASAPVSPIIGTSEPGPSEPGTSGPPDPPVSSPRPKFPPRPTPPPKSPTDASPGAPVTVTGTVSPGVEGGCLLLNGYLLIGGRRDVLKPGARVTVAGHVQRDLASTCQQGTPLVVESVRPA